ncbi:glycosyltransferase family 2 protein [Arenicellales bacterium IMCC55707]
MTSRQSKFSVIVPCFNEENGVEQTFNELKTCLKNLGPHEIIMINDGSSDKTPEILAQIAEKNEGIRVISTKRNRGYGAALKLGIQRAQFDTIVITDADRTYPAEAIPDLLEVFLKEDADMIVGARTGKSVTYSRLRAIPKFFLNHYAQWIVNHDIPDLNSGLRIFKKSIAQRFLSILPDGFSFTTTITLSMLANFYKVEFYPTNYYERIGKSKIRPVRDTLKFLNLIVRAGIYFAPYRVFGPIGLTFGLAAVASLIYDYTIMENLSGKTLVLLLLGLNTLFFAVVAEMIDRRVPN